eukprot:1464010-Rhodomonas_salina.1
MHRTPVTLPKSSSRHGFNVGQKRRALKNRVSSLLSGPTVPRGEPHTRVGSVTTRRQQAEQ